jgi:flagellar biosynthetic protein FliQ
MTPEFAVEMIKLTLVQAVVLAGPLLAVALVVGLAVSLFQAVTSIHEQTLSFVPKALALTGLTILLLPWFLRTTVEFTAQLMARMPEMVH